MLLPELQAAVATRPRLGVFVLKDPKGEPPCFHLPPPSSVPTRETSDTETRSWNHTATQVPRSPTADAVPEALVSPLLDSSGPQAPRRSQSARSPPTLPAREAGGVLGRGLEQEGLSRGPLRGWGRARMDQQGCRDCPARGSSPPQALFCPGSSVHTRPLLGPSGWLMGQAEPSVCGQQGQNRTGTGAGGRGPNRTLPGLCTLSGGPGLPRRRRTISPDSRLGSRAAPLSDQWRSSRSPGTRQTGALAQTRTNPQRARRIPVSVDHPPQAHTALPAKTPCTFSFKHQGRSSNTDNYTRAHTRLTLHLHVISNSQESSEKYSCTVTS